MRDGLPFLERVNPALWALLSVLLPAVGAASLPGVAIRPEDRKWENFGLAERIPVMGDLADPDCPSVTLLRLVPDTRLPPHSAPVDRTYLLLSGTVHLGTGSKWDETRMRALPAGSYWVVPANTSTFEWAEQGAVCQVVSTRPGRNCPRPQEVSIHLPDRIEWRPDGPAERVVLLGEPGHPACPHAERLRLPKDVPAPLPADASSRNAVWSVLSGALRRADPTTNGPRVAPELPAGTVAGLAADEAVVGGTPSRCVVQRDFPGTGPPACRWRYPRR